MKENQPDISLEEAKEKTKKVGGTIVNFEQMQTVFTDFYAFKKDIESSISGYKKEIQENNQSVRKIEWFFNIIIVTAVVTTILLLSDYFQFATKAYEQFNTTIKEQTTDHKTIESMNTDIQLIKNKLKIP